MPYSLEHTPRSPLIYELRTYELKVAKAVEYLELFRTVGVGFITRHLPMGGYFMTETGALNRIHHLWIYENWAERTALRVAASQDTDWNTGFVPAAFPLILAQRNACLRLLSGSELLSRVCANRRRIHTVQSRTDPLFARRLLSLAYLQGVPAETSPTPGAHAGFPTAAASPAPAHIGLWQVTSGYRPNTCILLQACDEADVLDPPGAGTLERELLRPLAISPLQ